jgi:hypothetical protein
MRLDVRVGERDAWPNLSRVTSITGKIEVIDDYDPDDDEYGIAVVDLGGVREMKYPTRFVVQGVAQRIVGTSLESACDIDLRAPETRGQDPVVVELPRLTKARHVQIGSDRGFPRELVLPELTEVKTLVIQLATRRPSIVRLPKLARGSVEIVAPFGFEEKRATKSVIAIPTLRASSIRVRKDHAAFVERLLEAGRAY